MKVMRFNDHPDAPALIAGDAPIPAPGPGELLVRVHAAGVTPTELLWYPATHAADGTRRTGAIPGHEFSGTVERVGEGVDPEQIGSEVFGMNDWFADGATADYCLTKPASVTPKPTTLSHAQAASVPISALTAWQGLFDRLKLQAGERILIHGGAGGVGLFAVQLARRAGAHVIVTASARHFGFLSQLGADEPIDYHAGGFETRVGKVDAVFDAVGGATLARSWDVLAPNGRLVTIAADSEGTPDERTKKAFFIVEPNGGQLAQIAHLLAAGELRCFVGAEVPFASASAVYQDTLPRRDQPGKVVVSFQD